MTFGTVILLFKYTWNTPDATLKMDFCVFGSGFTVQFLATFS